MNLKVEKVSQEVAALWINMVRSAAQKNGDEQLEIQTRDANGIILGTFYADFTPEYFDITSSEASENLVSNVILPFNPQTRSVLFKAFNTELLFSLPVESLRCVRPCISSAGVAGQEEIDSCCSGSIKSPVNSYTFVCVPTASPSPSPAM